MVRSLEEKNAYARTWRQQNKERVKELNRNFYSRNKEKVRQANSIYRKRKYRELKDRIFEILGKRCSNPFCKVPGGMDDPRALQIDHIFNNGKEEIRTIIRKKSSIGYLKYLLKRLEEGSQEYQLLCANCNIIKYSIFRDSET